MITLRLDSETEKRIEMYSKSKGISKSELVRKSINEYFENHLKPNLYDVGKKYFDKYNLDNEDLSVNSENILRSHFSNDATVVLACEKINTNLIASADTDFEIYRFKEKNTFTNLIDLNT